MVSDQSSVSSLSRMLMFTATDPNTDDVVSTDNCEEAGKRARQCRLGSINLVFFQGVPIPDGTIDAKAKRCIF